jgi:hypothetical protein
MTTSRAGVIEPHARCPPTVAAVVSARQACSGRHPCRGLGAANQRVCPGVAASCVCFVRVCACNATHPVAPEFGPFPRQIPGPILRTKQDRDLRSWDTNPFLKVALQLRGANGLTTAPGGLPGGREVVRLSLRRWSAQSALRKALPTWLHLCRGAPTIADGAYQGTGLLIPHRKRRGQTHLSQQQETENAVHRRGASTRGTRPVPAEEPENLAGLPPRPCSKSPACTTWPSPDNSDLIRENL